jgi:protein gp37
MAEFTKIQWADHTFNPWIGCSEVSDACEKCYAKNAADHRFHLVEWGPHGVRRRTKTQVWRQPLRWNANAERFAAAHGRRQRLFCASWADVFDNQVPPPWRHDLWDLIRQTPQLDWMLLSKRPQNIRKMLAADWGEGWPHVWLGVTGENQPEYDRRWRILARIPAAVRFVSYEPALGPLQVNASAGVLPHWLICGGESGPHARAMNPAWARTAMRQCADAGISFFMKQIGSNHTGWPAGITGKSGDPAEWPADPAGTTVSRYVIANREKRANK